MFTFSFKTKSFSFGQIETDVYFYPGYEWNTTLTFVDGMTYVGYKIVVYPSLGNLLGT